MVNFSLLELNRGKAIRHILMQEMKKTKPPHEVGQPLRFEFEEPLTIANSRYTRVSSGRCSTTCLCKHYFPCRIPKHNPCKIRIPLEQNHTHVLLRIISGGTIINRKRVCVSPKCVGTFRSFATLTAPISCSLCFYRRRAQEDSFLIYGTAPGNSLIWLWRKSVQD